MRAAVYARYSSDLQKATSIADQIAMAERLCAEQGWTLEAVFTDEELSGRTNRRPGFKALVDRARRRDFDVIVVEAVDRLTRRITHALHTYELLEFGGIALHSVTEGKQDFMRVLLNALGAQMFSEMIGAHTRRGMQGAVGRKRLHTSAYGYRILKADDGLNRAIDPEQAAVVLRIFEHLVEGKSAHRIAHELNRDRIPAPRGGSWDPSSIRGNATRFEGIARNRLYVGIASVCKIGRKHDPETGAKSSFATPQDTVEIEIPELRIVPQELWDRAQAAMARQSAKLAGRRNPECARRKKTLLSGLLRCGACGHPYVIAGHARYGCREARKHACDNRVTIARADIEATVMRRLETRLRHPEFKARFEKALAAERKRLEGDGPEKEVRRLQTALTAIEKKRANIFRAIEDGAPYAVFRDRADALDAETREITRRLERARRSVSGSGGAIEKPADYESVLRRLTAMLSDPDLVDQAQAHVATLVPKVVLHPDPQTPLKLRIEVKTNLDPLLPRRPKTK